MMENRMSPALPEKDDPLLSALEENRVLKKEIRISREAAEVTARLVVRQFEETEKILCRFQVANAQRKAVLDSATHISIMATDASGLIKVFNTGAQNLLGYSEEEIIDQERPERFHLQSELSRHAITLSARLNRTVQPDRVLYEYAALGFGELMEWVYLRKDNTSFPVSMAINSLQGGDGDMAGFLCIAIDISDRKRAEAALQKAHGELESRVEVRTAELAEANRELQKIIAERVQAEAALAESEKKFRSIFENATNGFYQSTPEGRLLTVNPAMVRILGYESAEEMISTVVSLRDQVYVHAKDRINILEIIDNKGHATNFETQFYRKDGRIIDVSVSGIPVRNVNGKTLYYEGAIEDITQKKRAEVLKIEKEAAEAATAAKSNFLANMSHEIRTPMNAIIGLTELALKTELTPKQYDYLNKIHSSGHTLLGIINDILDFSKIEAGKLEMEQIDFSLDEVMNNLSDMFSDRVAGKGIELLQLIPKDVPKNLVGDPLRLGQVLINLVSNAVKFTEEGHVVVKVSVVKKEDKIVRLRFVIQDSGIGISRENLPKLFASFTQADGTTTRKYGGTGLGLAICKRLVKMMGGSIDTESEEGVGTTVQFTAEFGFKTPPLQKNTLAPRGFRSKRILVVDNNETSRQIFEEILTSFSFRTLTVPSGNEALVELKSAADNRDPYAMVLLDWRMPGMDGIGTLKAIRRTPGIAQTPVVMMTAFGREEVMNNARLVGADAFLIKPIKQSLLFDTIMNLFHRNSPESASSAPVPVKLAPSGGGHFCGRRVLLAEDNLINQQVATEILQDAGIIVDIANNGKEAVAAVAKAAYDAVLMDVQMPEMDGYDACRHIRSDIRFKALPIIAMTAHAMRGDREKCLEAGMNEHVTKPIDTEILFAALSRWITPESQTDAIVLPAKAASSPPAEDFPASLPGIDLTVALKRIRNKTLFKKLLVEFADSYTVVAQKIRGALKDRDMESAIRYVHTVKGVAGNFSAMALYEASQMLEAAIRRGQDHEIVFHQFEQSLNTVLAAAESFRITKPEPAGTTEHTEMEGMFRRLGMLLQRNEFEAEECFESLKKHLDASIHHQELEVLSCHIRNLDFTNAVAILAELAQKSDIRMDGGANG
ncbi:MAG: response regulator [Pseudomonadota bacterium]